MRDESPSRKNLSTVPQKTEPFDFAVQDEDEDDFADYSGQSGWRIEQRFYTKKDGTIMLYWNYRSREPVYINGERKIKYRKGGKKVWQQLPKKKRKS